MSNHHAGNPQRAPHAETEPAPRRTPFLLTDARRAKPHPIQLRAGTPHTPHHAAPPRTGSSTNPHMPAASAAPLPQPQHDPATPTPTAHFRHRDPTPTRTPFTLRDILLWCVLPVLIVLGLRLFVFGMYAIPSGSMENTIMPGDRVITTRLSPRPIALRRGDIIVFKDPANWLANEGATHNSDRLIKRLIGPIALRRGDIIVFKDPANWLANEGATHNSDRLIKRLIGLPGDTVECAGNGAPIVINGVPIDESAYLKPGVEPSRSAFSVTVPAGRLFVLGNGAPIVINGVPIDESAYLKPGVEPSRSAFSVTVPAGRLFVLGDNRANSADSRAHTNDGARGLVPVSDVEGVAFMRYWPLNRVGWLSAHHDVFHDVPTRTPTS